MADNHSVASSRSNLSGSTKGRLAATFFSQTFPIFPFFMGLQANYPVALIHVGLFVQFMQILGFVFTPRLLHGESLQELAKVVYAFQLPFWDPLFVPSITYTKYIALFYICVALTIALLVSILWWILSGAPVQRDTLIFKGWRLAVHSFSTWLYIPLLMALLSNVVCTVSTPTVMWSLQEACYTSATTPNMVLGVVAIIFLLLTVVPILTSVFVVDTESKHPLARSATDIDFIFFLWKTILCVLFHVFMAHGKSSWIAMTVILTAAMVAFAVSFLVPYYSQVSNRNMTSAMMIIMLGAFVSYLSQTLSRGSTFVEMDIDAVVFVSFVLPLAWIGRWCADFRLNPDLTGSLAYLVDAGAPPPPSTYLVYPHRLPITDLAYSVHREICAEIGDQSGAEDDVSLVQHGPSLLTPFITTVWVPTDIEVACRFLGIYYQLVHQWPKPQMLLLAARIFTKGLTKFWDSARIVVALSNYAFNYAGKASLGMQQLERVQRIETTFNLRFVAFKLTSDLKAELNLRDTSYQKVCDVAKKLHKETLVHMHQFWSKLVSGQVDVQQLALLATLITQRRQQGKQEFLRALAYQNNDRGLMTKYAGFLEQVMMEPEQAEQLRIYTKAEAEDRKRSGLRGRNKQNSQKSNIDDLIHGNTKNAKQEQNFSRTLVILLFGCLILLVGVFVTLTVLNDDARATSAATAFSAGKSRALASEGALLSVQYLVGKNVSDEEQHLGAINNVADDLLAFHNRVTRGDQKARYGVHRAFLKEPLVFTQRFTSNTTNAFHQTNFWGLGFDVVQMLKSVLYLGNKTTVEKDVALSTFAIDFPSWTSVGFNRSSHMTVDAYQIADQNATMTLTIFYAITVVLICVAAGITAMGSGQVLALKLSILSLFPIIPRGTLQRLCQQARERVDQYDAQDDDVGGENAKLTEKDYNTSGEENLADSTNRPQSEGQSAVGSTGDVGDDHDDNAEEELKKKLLTDSTSGGDGNTDNNNSDSGDSSGMETTNRKSQVTRRDLFTMTGLLAVLVTLTGLSLALLLADIQLIDHSTELADRHRILLEHQETFFNLRHSLYRYIATGSKASETKFKNGEVKAIALLQKEALTNPPLPEMTSFLDSTETAQAFLQTAANMMEEWGAHPSQTLEINASTGLLQPIVPEGEAVRAKVFSPSGNIAEAWNAYTGQMHAYAKRTFDDLDADSSLEGHGQMAISLAVLAFLAAFVFMVVPYFYRERKAVFFQPTQKTMFAACVCFLLLCGVVQSLNIWAEQNYDEARVDIEHYYAAKNDTLLTFSSMHESVEQFVQTGDLRAYNAYFDDSKSLGSFPLTILFDTDETSPAKTFFLRQLNEVRHLENIGIRLTAKAYGINESDTLEVNDFTWDFDQESQASTVRVDYGVQPLRYTTTAADFAKSADIQKAIARYTIFSERYVSLADALEKIIVDKYDDMVDGRVNDREMYATLNQAFHLAALALCGATLLLFVMYCLRTATVLIHFSSRLSTGSGSSGRSNSTRSSSLDFKLGLVFLAIFMLFTAILAVSLVSIEQQKHGARNIDAATSREWIIANSMVIAEGLDAGLTHLHTARISLLTLAESMNLATRMLYFGEVHEDGYNMAGKADAHDSYLYSKNQALDTLHSCGFELPGSTSSALLLSKGCAAAATGWEVQLRELAIETDPAQLIKRVNRMRLQVAPLLRAVSQSSNMVKDHVEERIVYFRNINIGLCCVTVVFILGCAIWVLLPHFRAQVDDEQGSRLLLHLIPKEVCTSVPAIAEFLENEKLLDAKSGGEGDSSSEIHVVPIVAIDVRGVVLKFNAAAENIFGYTAAEVVGNKVNLLMPQKIAAQHDRFLSNYRKTGVRKVIGYERQVHARNKSGDFFPVELSIKEFKRENGDVVYVGFIKDIAKNLELQSAQELNNMIQELATVPMIAIDSLGTIVRFNHAAEECFLHNASEVVNQNVKVLMPESIAARHDAYLAAYLRTGQKHIIDSTRVVTGVKKSGDEFPLEISVKEIKSDLGAMSTYLGFVRDLTQDLILDEINKINENICDLSPVPIVGIDPYGKVLKFNTAASHIFGYEQKEVLDNNIKMLMPQQIADEHDGYLEAYRRTGKKTIIGAEREVQGRHKDGTLFPLNAMIREVKKEGSNQGTFIGYLVDLTEEKKAEYRKNIDDAIVNLMAVPLCVIDDIGTIKRVNRALLLEFGYRLDEVLDQNVKILTPLEIATQHDRYMADYKRTGIKKVIGYKRRARAKRKNGITFPVELTVNEVLDSDKISTFIGFIRNLTEELALEQSFLVNNTCLEISTIPMIAINHLGRIISFSAAAEKVWGYKREDVEDKNVKMLMPEHISSNHDAYLANYRRTGIKKVVDTVSHQEAMDAEGRVFPVEICIKEVKKEGQNSKFVGYIRDTTLDDETRHIIERNEQISNLSPLPLIHIDLYGTVLHYNVAAQLDFQYSRDEVIGRNIKMLVPDEIAKHHDTYLANYRKTRVRNVIGTLRRTRGKRKDGRTFAVEIAVSEIEVEGDADKNSYVGYIRNVQEELFLIKANEVSGAIADLSPSPLIAIDDRGTIIKFNKAACDAFRYPGAEEVMGRNIKMLMPEEIAVNHDGYLIAYKKTRQKSVIDGVRRVKAKRSDGTFFPVEIMVKEITKLGRESTYLSYLRDLTMDEDMETATKVADTISELSTSSIIMIDQIGTIERVNPAVLKLFKYGNQEELVGKNIKMLTPPHIAKEHDRYLSTYLRTGVKSVIGNKRQVPAMAKDGEIIQVEISVEEVQIAGATHYIGYIFDKTQDLILQQQRYTNNIIVSNSPVPIVVINPRGIVQQFSPAACAFWGFAEEDVLGKNIKMLMPEDIARDHDGYLERYLETGEAHVIGSVRRATARMRSGTHVPVSLMIREVTSKTGTENNYMGFIRDLTSTFSVEMSLKISTSMLDMIPMSIISINAKGIIREFSKEATEFFGYTREEVMGQNLKMLMPEEIAVNHDGYLETYARTGERHVIGNARKVPARHKNGSKLSIEILINEFELDGEKLYVGYARDMGQQEKIQENARMQEALVELATVPIVAIDVKGTIIRFSGAAARQFGYDESEVMGKNVKILMEDHVAMNHDAYLARYQKTGEPHILDKKIELRAKRKDGEVFEAELVVKEIKKSGKDSMFVGYARDITQELQHRSHAILCSAIEELMPDPLIVIDEKGTVQTFTKAAQALWGYSSEEVLGMNVKMLMPEEISKDHDTFLSNYRRTKIKHVIDSLRKVSAKRKNGTLVEVELRITELAISKEKSYYVAYVRDCTKDYDLMLQTEVGAALIECNPDAIIMIDTKGAILKFNQTAEQLFCFERQQVIRRNIKILMPDNVAVKHDGYLSQYLKSRQKKIIDNSRIVTAEKKNGDTFKAQVSVKEICDAEGNPQQYVGYIRPV